MILSFLFLLLAVLLIFLGAELLLRSTSHLSQSFSLSSLDMGLIFGGLAASLPLSILTNFGNSVDQNMVMQTALGACIPNVGLLGLFLLFRSCTITHALKWRKLPLLLLVYLLLFFVMLGGKISKAEGVYLLIVLFFYILAQFFFPEKKEESEEKPSFGGTLLQCGIFIASTLLLIFGTKYFFTHFPALSHPFELLLLCIPQIAIAILCIIHKKGEFFLGTILGSNAFILLMSISFSALKQPIHFTETMLKIFFPIMVGFTFLLWLLTFQKKQVLSYLDGIILLVFYIGSIAFLFFR